MKKDESLGTQKFFSFLGPVIDALVEGKVILIDELDARLHPNLALLIVSLFNNSSDNRYGAQLIFSSHNSLILKKKILRRDQILMVYKTIHQNTIIESYQDLNIRSDAAYDVEYLNLEERLALGLRDQQLDLFD